MRVIFRLAMSGVIASGGLGSEVLVDAMPQRGGMQVDACFVQQLTRCLTLS